MALILRSNMAKLVVDTYTFPSFLWGYVNLLFSPPFFIYNVLPFRRKNCPYQSTSCLNPSFPLNCLFCPPLTHSGCIHPCLKTKDCLEPCVRMVVFIFIFHHSSCPSRKASSVFMACWKSA